MIHNKKSEIAFELQTCNFLNAKFLFIFQGVRKRLVLCMSRWTGEKTGPENCAVSDRPADTEQCRGDDCDETSQEVTV